MGNSKTYIQKPLSVGVSDKTLSAGKLSIVKLNNTVGLKSHNISQYAYKGQIFLRNKEIRNQ